MCYVNFGALLEIYVHKLFSKIWSLLNGDVPLLFQLLIQLFLSHLVDWMYVTTNLCSEQLKRSNKSFPAFQA